MSTWMDPLRVSLYRGKMVFPHGLDDLLLGILDCMVCGDAIFLLQGSLKGGQLNRLCLEDYPAGFWDMDIFYYFWKLWIISTDT